MQCGTFASPHRPSCPDLCACLLPSCRCSLLAAWASVLPTCCFCLCWALTTSRCGACEGGCVTGCGNGGSGDDWSLEGGVKEAVDSHTHPPTQTHYTHTTCARTQTYTHIACSRVCRLASPRRPLSTLLRPLLLLRRRGSCSTRPARKAPKQAHGHCARARAGVPAVPQQCGRRLNMSDRPITHLA